MIITTTPATTNFRHWKETLKLLFQRVMLLKGKIILNKQTLLYTNTNTSIHIINEHNTIIFLYKHYLWVLSILCYFERFFGTTIYNFVNDDRRKR